MAMGTVPTKSFNPTGDLSHTIFVFTTPSKYKLNGYFKYEYKINSTIWILKMNNILTISASKQQSTGMYLLDFGSKTLFLQYTHSKQ